MKKQRNYCSHSLNACHLKDSHSSKQHKSLLKYSTKRRGKVGIQTNCSVYLVRISLKLFVSNCWAILWILLINYCPINVLSYLLDTVLFSF